MQPPGGKYFCDEPWTGIFSVRTNGDVVCCPCYAKVRIGNINDASLHEIWNGEKMQHLRRAFSEGRLPDECRGQICPVVVGGANGQED